MKRVCHFEFLVLLAVVPCFSYPRSTYYSVYTIRQTSHYLTIFNYLCFPVTGMHLVSVPFIQRPMSKVAWTKQNCIQQQPPTPKVYNTLLHLTCDVIKDWSEKFSLWYWRNILPCCGERHIGKTVGSLQKLRLPYPTHGFPACKKSVTCILRHNELNSANNQRARTKTLSLKYIHSSRQYLPVMLVSREPSYIMLRLPAYRFVRYCTYALFKPLHCIFS